MALNISFQLCGFAFLILIIILLANRRLAKTITLKTYLYLLIGSTVSTILDILSVISLNIDGYENSGFTAVVCRLYLISLIVTAYLFLLYVFVRLEIKKQVMFVYRIIMGMIIVLYTVSGFFLELNYHVTDKEVYTYGEYVTLAYIVAGVVFVLTSINALHARDKLDRHKVKPMAFLIIVLGVAVFIQFLNNQYLLISFALSIAMVYMYLCLENPGEYIDKISGLFNSEGANMIISENKEKKRKYFIVSLEDFKFINDTFGAVIANEIINSIVSVLRQIPCEIVFRAAGTTFVLVFDYEETNMDSYITQIRDRFKNNFDVSNVSIVVKTKFFLLDQEELEIPISKLIQYIDYFVKDYASDDETDIKYIMKDEIEEKKKNDDIENSIIKALNNNELMVYYQPIYNNKKEIFTSAEALMRIKDDEGKFIPPDTFIPIAEKNGLIVKLGMELFEKVCSFVAKNNLQETCLEYIDVNLSVIQCMQHDLADKLLAVMEKYNINPSFINFEITETAASNSESTLLMNMKKLIDLNSSFSLDDYGSGYSNINYVLELPICVLKYDKNMVWSSFEGEKGRVIMEYTVNMTKELRLKSLAEGVETKEQFERIKELGIEYTQGFYFSKPLPEEEFLVKIKEEMKNI